MMEVSTSQQVGVDIAGTLLTVQDSMVKEESYRDGATVQVMPEKWKW